MYSERKTLNSTVEISMPIQYKNNDKNRKYSYKPWKHSRKRFLPENLRENRDSLIPLFKKIITGEILTFLKCLLMKKE